MRVQIPEHLYGIRYYCADLECEINPLARGPWHERLECPRCKAQMTGLTPWAARQMFEALAVTA